VRVVFSAAIVILALLLRDASATETTLTIGTVNNGDMLRMRTLSADFTAKNPSIKLKWVTLEENMLRQRVTLDIATRGQQFDLVTIGSYEVPIWAARGWLAPLNGLSKELDTADYIPSIRDALSLNGSLYASPFYAESSMLFYRKDLAQKAGLHFPQYPSWDFINSAARKMTDRRAGVYGICLRGKAGWGENVALVTAIANSYGARWFDQRWNPQFDKPEWRTALVEYSTLLKQYGPPGATSSGFNDNLALFSAGKCAMWLDATVAASFLTDPRESTVASKVGFAFAPSSGVGKSANWLWIWSLAIPTQSKNYDAAAKFLAWASGHSYTSLVAKTYGWSNVPPGTRLSLYENPAYLSAAPFAQLTLASILAADAKRPTVKPVPYTGVQYVAIPEFQGLGTTVGQDFSATISGSTTVDQALKNAQNSTTRIMRHAGYLK